MGFPHSSVGKKSTCNAGDPSSIPELERCTQEGIGYTFQYSQASLVAQLVKNPPAMWENWVRSLGWEHPLEKGIQYSGLENSMDRIVHGVTKSQTQLSDFYFTSLHFTSGDRQSPLFSPGKMQIPIWFLHTKGMNVYCSHMKCESL